MLLVEVVAHIKAHIGITIAASQVPQVDGCAGIGGNAGAVAAEPQAPVSRSTVQPDGFESDACTNQGMGETLKIQTRKLWRRVLNIGVILRMDEEGLSDPMVRLVQDVD